MLRLHRCAAACELQRFSVQEDRSEQARAFAMEAAAPAAMETEPTKVSIKTMKEVIRSAGLATADLLESATSRRATNKPRRG